MWVIILTLFLAAGPAEIEIGPFITQSSCNFLRRNILVEEPVVGYPYLSVMGVPVRGEFVAPPQLSVCIQKKA